MRNKPDGAANDGKPDDSMGIGARSGIEFVAAIVVSALIGFGIDKWLHTSPVALLILLALGFAAGLLNVYRAMNGIGYGQGYAKPVVEDDKDS